MLTFGAKKNRWVMASSSNRSRANRRAASSPRYAMCWRSGRVSDIFFQEPQVQVCFKAWGAQAAIPFRVSALADAGQRLLTSWRAGFPGKMN
jgi:hypothetical protein